MYVFITYLYYFRGHLITIIDHLADDAKNKTEELKDRDIKSSTDSANPKCKYMDFVGKNKGN